MTDQMYLGNRTIMPGCFFVLNAVNNMTTNFSSVTDACKTYTHETFIAPTDGADYLLRKYSLPFLCVVGFIGNMFSAFLFLGKALRKFSCCVFLGVRSIADTIFLATLIVAWLDFLDIRIFHTTGICHVVIFLSYVSSFMAVWCVVFVTLENYLRMCHTQYIKMFCSSKNAVIIVICLLLVTLCLYNLPLWSNEVIEMSSMHYCVIKKKYLNYQLILTYIDTATTLIIPLVIILGFMCIILYKGISHSRSRLRLGYHGCKHTKRPTYGTVARLLTAVSITFIFLHTPIHIFKLKVIIDTVTHKYDIASSTDRAIGNVLQVLYYLNSSINFVVYFICGRNFRNVCKEIISSSSIRIIMCCNSNSQSTVVSDSRTSHFLAVFKQSSSSTKLSRRNSVV